MDLTPSTKLSHHWEAASTQDPSSTHQCCLNPIRSLWSSPLFRHAQNLRKHKAPSMFVLPHGSHTAHLKQRILIILPSRVFLRLLSAHNCWISFLLMPIKMRYLEKRELLQIYTSVVRKGSLGPCDSLISVVTQGGF